MICRRSQSSHRRWDLNLRAHASTPWHSFRQDRVPWFSWWVSDQKLLKFSWIFKKNFPCWCNVRDMNYTPFPGYCSHRFVVSIVDISGLAPAMLLFFKSSPTCPWGICLSPGDNWFGIPVPLFIITWRWFARNMALMLEDWLCAKKSLLGILAVWC